jgi:transposase-like protein
MIELRSRGVEGILIAVVDGLKGFPEAIAAVFPRTQVQACIVHLIRNSLDLVSYKDRHTVAAALKEIYRAPHAEAGRAALDEFSDGPWGRKYPAITATWVRQAVLNRRTEIARKLASELALPPAQRNRIGLNDTGAGDGTPSPWDEFFAMENRAPARRST